jgi:hypothetical protein
VSDQKAVTTTGSAATCQVIQWRPHGNGDGTLRGHADLEFANGIRVLGTPVFNTDRGPGVGTSSIHLIDRDGVQLRDENGQRRYDPAITFSSSLARQRWEAAVLAALRQARMLGPDPRQIELWPQEDGRP